MSEKDVKDASAGVLLDLKRFQAEKEEDLKRYMVRQSLISTGYEGMGGSLTEGTVQIAYARCHIDWAKKNLETWREAREEVEKIEVR